MMSKKTISVASKKAKARRLQDWTAKQIAKLLSCDWGKDCVVASREMGQSGTDIRLIGEAQEKFNYSVECKNQETWSLPAWIKQAKANQKENTNWLLVCKRNHHEPIVVLDATVFFGILKQLLEYQLKSIDKASMEGN